MHYYVQGAYDEADSPGNEWRTASDWPLLAAPTKYFLSRDGELQLSCPPSPSSTLIVADPEHKADNGTGSTSFPGARDARFFESQTDRVKTFTTAPLTEPVEWTGAVHAAIAVRVGAPDCDVIVRVCDVYPDGRSILIADHHRRASFRHSLNEPPLPPLSAKPKNSTSLTRLNRRQAAAPRGACRGRRETPRRGGGHYHLPQAAGARGGLGGRLRAHHRHLHMGARHHPHAAAD